MHVIVIADPSFVDVHLVVFRRCDGLLLEVQLTTFPLDARNWTYSLFHPVKRRQSKLYL